MSRSKALWMLAGVIVLGALLRSYELTARSLWFDEAFSWRLVNFSFSEMITRGATDVHPLLYYVFLRGWGEVFGTSLLALRSFSVAMAGATIAAAYLFTASALKNRAAGLFAAALLALSGWQIAFAWEARMYTLGTFLALCSSWLLLKAVRASQRNDSIALALSWWAGYAVFGAAFAHTHYFAFFTLAAHAIWVLGALLYSSRGRIGEILHSRLTWLAVSAAVVMVLFYVPWIPVFLSQNAQVQDSYWVPPIGGWSIPDTFYRMFLPTSGIPPHGWPELLLATLPIIAVVLLWVWVAARCKRDECDASWLIILGGMVPFLLAIMLSFVGQSLYQDRFLVFANLFILIAVATAVMRISHIGTRRALVGIFLIFFIGAFGRYWTELDVSNKAGARGATELVFASRQENEPVLATSPFIFFAVDHYAQENFNSGTAPKLYTESSELLHFAGGPILRPDDIITPGKLQELSADTIWLVETSGFGSSEVELPASWKLTAHDAFNEVYSYQGQVFVNKYERR